MKLMVPTSKTVKIYTHSFFFFVWGGILTNRILQNIKEGNSSVICFGGGCGFLFLFFFTWSWRSLRRRRCIPAPPCSRIRTVPGGFGERTVLHQGNPHLKQHLMLGQVSRAGPTSLWPPNPCWGIHGKWNSAFPFPLWGFVWIPKDFSFKSLSTPANPSWKAPSSPACSNPACVPKPVPQPLQDGFPGFSAHEFVGCGWGCLQGGSYGFCQCSKGTWCLQHLFQMP